MQRLVPRNQVGTGVGLYNGLAMMIGGSLGPVVVGGVVSATGGWFTSDGIPLTRPCGPGFYH